MRVDIFNCTFSVTHFVTKRTKYMVTAVRKLKDEIVDDTRGDKPKAE